MPTISSCPSIEQLRGFAVGQLPEAAGAELLAHVDACSACEAALARFDHSDDLLIRGVRRSEAALGSQADASLERVLSRIAEFDAACALPLDTLGAADEATDQLIDEFPSANASLGEYELLGSIGSGGMGAVYKARHGVLDRVVAIKILPQSRLTNPALRERFQREIRAVAHLDHPNIVRATDAGVAAGVPFLVMEFIDGADLGALLRQYQRVGVAEGCELVRQAALAVDEAHRRGLVHRDVKPSNLMLSRAGEVKLLDLGLAKWQHGDASRDPLTATGGIVGTVDYLAPEQIVDDRTAGPAADIYALGCTLYALLAGHPPFGIERYATPLSKVLAHAHDAPVPLAELRDDLPRGLSDIVGQLLEKDPGNRPATAAAVADLLAPFALRANLAPLVANRDALSANDVGEPALELPPDVRALFRSPRAKPVAMRRLAAAAALLFMAAAAYGYWQANGASAREAAVANKKTRTSATTPPTEPPQRPLNPTPNWLGTAVPKPTQQDHDGNFLHPNAVARLGSVSLRHARGLVFLKFTADGRSLFSCSYDRTVRIWDAATGHERQTFYINRSAQRAAALSPDGGKMAVATSSAGIVVWDTASGRVLFQPGDPGGVLDLSISTDGKWLAAACGDGKLRFWSLESGKASKAIEAHRGGAGIVAFAPDGRTIASAGADGLVRLWNWPERRPLAEAALPAARSVQADNKTKISAAAWSPAADHLAVATSDGNVQVCAARELATLSQWRAHGRPIHDLDFSPDGALLATAGGRELLVWDWKARKATFRSPPQTGLVDSVAFAPDGRTVASGAGMRVGDVPRTRDIYHDAAIRLWNLEEGAESKLTDDGSFDPTSLAATPDGQKLIVPSQDETAAVWDVAARKQIATIEGLGHGEKEVAVSPDGRLAAMNNGEHVILIGTDDWQRVGNLYTPMHELHQVTFSPDSQRLAGGASTGTVFVWDVEQQKVLRQFDGFEEMIWCILYSPDGTQLALTHWNGTVEVIDADTGEVAFRHQEHRGKVRALAYSDDGELLASGSEDGRICMWNANSGELLRSEQTAGGISAIVFSRDGRTLIWGDYVDRLQLIDIDGAAPFVQSIGRYGSSITALARIPGDRLLASSMNDGTILLWNLPELLNRRPIEKNEPIDK